MQFVQANLNANLNLSLHKSIFWLHIRITSPMTCCMHMQKHVNGLYMYHTVDLTYRRKLIGNSHKIVYFLYVAQVNFTLDPLLTSRLVHPYHLD